MIKKQYKIRMVAVNQFSTRLSVANTLYVHIFLGLMNVHYMPRKNGQIVYIIAKSTLCAVFLRANSVQVVPALECYNDFIQ